MTAPLDEKGLLPCPFCGAQANSHQLRARSVRFVCPDCEASGPIADGNPEQEQVWEDARIAWNRRAYLAVSPSPSMEMEVVELLHEAIDAFDADIADGWADAEQTGERPDLWPQETTVPIDLLRQAQSALAAKDAEAKKWWLKCCETQQDLNAAEAQVLRLTEENEALRKERTSLIETKREQIEQLTAERDAMARHSLRAGNDAARMAIEKKALADLVKEHGSAKLIRLARTTLQKEQADG